MSHCGPHQVGYVSDPKKRSNAKHGRTQGIIKKAHELKNMIGGKVLIVIEDEAGNSQIYTNDEWWALLSTDKFCLNYTKKAERIDHEATQIEMIKRVGSSTKHIVTTVVPERPTPTKSQTNADLNFIPYKDVIIGIHIT